MIFLFNLDNFKVLVLYSLINTKASILPKYYDILYNWFFQLTYFYLNMIQILLFEYIVIRTNSCRFFGAIYVRNFGFFTISFTFKKYIVNVYILTHLYFLENYERKIFYQFCVFYRFI